MAGPTWVRAQLLVGAVTAAGVLMSPAWVAGADQGFLLAAVLPLSFFGCGAVALVLRPRHRVGERLLQTGLLHLLALGLGLAALTPGVGDTVAAACEAVAALAYVLGFVALFDLLLRFPDGHHAWAAASTFARGSAVAAVALVGLLLLGSARMPSLVAAEGHANPLQVPQLSWGADAVGAVFLLPVVGVALLVLRYRQAGPGQRTQLRWPLVAAVVVVVGLVTTGLLEDLLGPDGQAAVFIPAVAFLPASFLVGLLRHDEEVERLAGVEASRARLVEATLGERRRLERDLHDGAQQRLIGLLAQVELVRERLDGLDSEAARQLGEIRDGLGSAHQELRELAHGIHPAALSDHGLAEAVRSAMARMPGRPTLQVAADLESARYEPGVESAVYLFVLECLTNAMKHTDDDAVRVELEARPHELVATVADQGPGLPPGVAEGPGLTGLRDRLAAVGGRLEVVTGATGTTVRGVVPAVPHG